MDHYLDNYCFKQYEEMKLKRHFDKDAHDENQGTDRP